MKVKVSKVFAKWMASACGVSAEVVTMNANQYRYLVGDEFDAIDAGDYDYENLLFRAIMVTYPDDYYACPMYLSTARLNSEFRRRGIRTEEELKKMIKDLCEI